MSKHTVLSNDPTDFERICKAINLYRLKYVDPDAYYTQCMFDKLKHKETDPGYDVEAWDNDSVWIPRGTKMKPHPWDKGELDNG